jgi:hypothetical protein
VLAEEAPPESAHMPHYSHKDLKEVSIYLSEEEETLSHAFLKEVTFKAHVEDAQRLIEKLRRHLRDRLGEAGRSGSSSTGVIKAGLRRAECMVMKIIRFTGSNVSGESTLAREWEAREA